MNNIEELKEQIQNLENENKTLKDQKDAYVKKSEYLSKELKKATSGKSGHLSTLEIITDLALGLCAALLITILTYTSNALDEGFFEIIKNSFAYIFK